MKKNEYQTKQKKELVELIRHYHTEFSIKEIYEKTDGVGLTTIYRFIEKLEKEGKVKKIILDGEVFYQYLEDCHCKNHFYLKCSNCGEMIHVDCDCIEDLSSHIEKNHQFQIFRDQLIIPGTCKKCSKKVNLC